MINPIVPKATKVALLQSKFHRITKHRMASALKALDLNTVEWIILGFLDHKGTRVPFSTIAEEVGIQDSFLTVTAGKLETRRFVEILHSSTDKRQKRLIITKEGKKALLLAQKQFVVYFAPLLKGISMRDLDTFLSIIKKIIKNETETTKL